MPKRELSRPIQIAEWLEDWGAKLTAPGQMILIGSGGLLWHAHQAGKTEPLPENSMDVDPITSCEEIAILAYDSIIGSEFEETHGWHVNLMPDMALNSFPEGWSERCSQAEYGMLTVIVPSPSDLLAPKLLRNEPRDIAHAKYMSEIGLYEEEQ